MPEPALAAKPCTVCGIDCAGRARVKDQQGRYMCQECFDRAKQAKHVQKAPPPPAASMQVPVDKGSPIDMKDNSFLLEMGGKESAGASSTKSCPECARALSASAVICIGCGYNLTTGKRMPVKVERAKKVKESSGGGGVDVGSGMVALVSLALYGLAFGSMFVPSVGVWPGLALFGFLSLAISIWAIVLAFKESFLWGIGCFLPIVGLYFVFSKNEDERLKAAYGVTILANITYRVLEGTGAIPALNP